MAIGVHGRVVVACGTAAPAGAPVTWTINDIKEMSNV